jgi:trimethylamine--corrinoid protein Co-methyltransferase
MVIEALAGGHLVHDLGYLESGLTGSLTQLALCDEIATWIRHFTRDVEISDETLALDLIEQAGPGGQYLEFKHTQRHFRERYYPRLIERDNYTGWVNKGSKTMAERAAERVESILETHMPQPLPPDVAAAIHAIVERAEARHSE